MPDHPLVVALLKEYAHEATLTRPEAGKILGLTLGQVAGIHHRNTKTIGPWPTLNPARKKNRRCQYPIGIPGTDEFHVCGAERGSDPLVCDTHTGMKWTPPEEK